jgi:hypothetical protein
MGLRRERRAKPVAALERRELVGEEVIGAEKVAPMPIGHAAGVTSSASDCSISSSRSKGSRPSRSSLLTKVMIGTSRGRQTSKSLRVCSSMPPWRHWGRRRVAPSLTLPRERGREGWGTAVRVR